MKPLIPKTSSYGHKRTQSGNPGAAKNANRFFQRDMINAQSYHYERGQIGSMGNDPMQNHTLVLSNNTSYPAFSSEVDINSTGVKHGAGQQQRNLIVGGPNTAATGSNYSTA